MLRFFNQLYRAGLLDPNSMTQTYDEMSQKVKNGGVFWGIFNYASSMVYNTDKHLTKRTPSSTVCPRWAATASGLSARRRRIRNCALRFWTSSRPPKAR